jgi:hypothetical protein
LTKNRQRGEIKLKQLRRVPLALLAVLSSSILTAPVGTSVAYAAEEPAGASTPAVIGYDEDGNPMYLTGSDAVADPSENPGDVAGADPWEDLNETKQKSSTGDTTNATGEKCTPFASVTLKNLKNNYDVAWTDSVTNKTRNSVQWEVVQEKEATFNFGISASASATVKAAIFGEVEVTLNASVEQSWTTKYGSKVTTTVPALTLMTAQRAVWQEKFSYKYTAYDKTCLKIHGSGTGWAPYKNNWLFTERSI